MTASDSQKSSTQMPLVALWKIKIGRFAGERQASSLELFLVAAVLFALPTSEAIKNIALVGFLGGFLIQSLRMRSFGTRNPFEIWIWLMIAAMWASMFTSDLRFEHDLMALGERWTLMALSVIFVGRLTWTKRQISILLGAFFVGATVGTIEAFWTWQSTSAAYPHLRSLRHVNSSVLYHLVTIGMAASVLISPKFSRWLRLAAALALAIAFVFLIPAKSTIGLLAVAMVGLVWIYFAVKITGLGKTLFLGASFVAILLGSAVLTSSDFRNELEARIFSDNPLSYRDAIFRASSEVFDQNLFLGSGVRTFALAVSEERVMEAVTTRGGNWAEVEDRFFFTNHGHNLMTNTMVERGLVGIILTLGLLLSYIWYFGRSLSLNCKENSFQSGLALGALLIATGFVFGGFGNTTMTNEHGHAGMLLIALMAANRRVTAKPG